jgi:hypothetical protein
VSLPAGREPSPVDGRLLILLSTDPDDEPRNQINLQLDSQIVAGVTVDGLQAGKPVIIDGRATAWPIVPCGMAQLTSRKQRGILGQQKSRSCRA